MNLEKELWTVTETARYFGISERTIYNRVRPGSTLKPFPIKPIKIGRLWRFRKSDINAYLSGK
jgi:excisionase family DNA binding protein